MPGIVVDYARFVEVQQRRARIVAVLERPREPPPPPTGRTAIEPYLDVGESVTSVDASTTRRTIDMR
jgi:hypothetical protein